MRAAPRFIRCVLAVLAGLVALAAVVGASEAPKATLARARENSARFARAVGAADRLMRVWLTSADPRTLLLPDRLDGPTGRHLAPSGGGP